MEEAKGIKDWIASKAGEIKEKAKEIGANMNKELKKWKDQAKNLLLSTLEKHFNLQKLKDDFNECKQSAEDAIKDVGDAKETIVKLFEDQKEKLENKEKVEVINTLKSVVDESGDTFIKFEKAAGCIAKKFGYKAYSISVGFSKG